MITKFVACVHRIKIPHKLLEQLPTWMKSTSLQQGIIFGAISLCSLFFMAFVTFLYVEYELDNQNYEIMINTQQIAQGFYYELDDDPIDDDDILAVMTSGFIIAGIMVSFFTAALVIAMNGVSQRQIIRIEQVLNAAAEGDLSARTGERHTFHDLGRVAVSVDEMLSRLEGSVAAMSDISSNIAHELKTPLTRLRHILLTLKEEAYKSPQSHSQVFLEDLDHALDDSQRLATIFDALLRISQIESGARRSRFTETDINHVIDIVAEIYCDVAEDANMRLIVHKSDTPLKIQGDRQLLIQQLANLIENALRYCPAGSDLNLSCGKDDEKDQVWVKLEDNGPGIADDEKVRVFERLYRVDKSRTDGGLGLGLSLAKAIAGLHHGDISLHDCNPGLSVCIRFKNPPTLIIEND